MSSRLNETEECIHDLEDKIMECIYNLEDSITDRKKKNESNIQNGWGNIKCANICNTGVAEGEERNRCKKCI